MTIVASFGELFIPIFYLYQIIFYLFFRKKEPKESTLKYYKFTCVTNFLIFCATIPVGLFIGIMATDSGEHQMISFILGFLFITGLPLLFFTWSLRDYLILQRSNK
ncbi:hypothetical protein [Lysinibacillus xylanilyticus]|uniref:Uncharacterized protein n=1 Tax=Lysinibacillus xylanilyticus TaxID=582475 RepID=A0ABT4ETS4_9BACI|nr:hypothetical protein [Lysinibacillus xylanilyticus]MCY9549075.1 hypothetical protein [Lysinibacillus xylanilyticus]